MKLAVLSFVAVVLALSSRAADLQIMPDGSAVLTPDRLCRGNDQSAMQTCAGRPDNDNQSIQDAIDRSRNKVFFKAGIYKLVAPVSLRSGKTYAGEGGFSYNYGSMLMQTVRNMAIFAVNGSISSVNINGLTFSGPAAKGVAGDSSSKLVNSTIRDNFFHGNLADGIAAPMSATRIERNGFGNYGPAPLSDITTQAHIRSSLPLNAVPGDNWITGNLFRSTCPSSEESPLPNCRSAASVQFDASGALYVTGNDFESNNSDTTLRVSATTQAVVQGNWFEANRGRTQVLFSKTGSYKAQLKDNFYAMFACPDRCVLVDFDTSAGAPQVSMSYEAGQNFTVSPVIKTELTSASGWQYLTIERPLCLRGYDGNMKNDNHCPL